MPKMTYQPMGKASAFSPLVTNRKTLSLSFLLSLFWSSLFLLFFSSFVFLSFFSLPLLYLFFLSFLFLSPFQSRSSSNPQMKESPFFCFSSLILVSLSLPFFSSFYFIRSLFFFFCNFVPVKIFTVEKMNLLSAFFLVFLFSYFPPFFSSASVFFSVVALFSSPSFF